MDVYGYGSESRGRDSASGIRKDANTITAGMPIDARERVHRACYRNVDAAAWRKATSEYGQDEAPLCM